MMKDAIKNFPSQFSWQPKIFGIDEFPKYKRFVLSGMGGSHLSGNILKLLRPELDFVIHSDYGLPKLSKQNYKKRLIIANSYSGNTEEVLDGLCEAGKVGFPILIIATGGALIKIAKEKNYPHILLPDTGIQPRLSTGFGLRALSLAVNDKKLLRDSEKLARMLKPSTGESEAKDLAERLKNKIPVIYSSTDNFAIAYNWKIKINETAKVPAFCNFIPELNHNEMSGFSEKGESDNFYFIFLTDSDDHPLIKKRFMILEKLYKERDLPIEMIELQGKNKLDKIFSSLLFADWTSVYLGELYGHETEKIPMVEEFKRLIA